MTLTLRAHKDQKYIPILALPNTKVVWPGALVADRYQYYRVQVDKSLPVSKFEALLFATSCSYSFCDMQMMVMNHPLGFSAQHPTYSAVGSCITTQGLNGDNTVTTPGSYCNSIDTFTSSSGSPFMVSSGVPAANSPNRLSAYLYHG